MMIPCEQTTRIERIEATVDKLAQTVTGISSDVRILTASVDLALKKVEDQDRTLRGENGDPGLVAVVNRLNVSMGDLYGALRGVGEQPGLIASIDTLVKKIADWDDSKKWMTRLVLGLVITSVVLAWLAIK